MSLCFTNSSLPRMLGKISDEQYYRAILQHFCGVRHKEDTDLAQLSALGLRTKLTSVCISLWYDSTQSNYKALSDLDTLIRTFLSAEKGNIKDVQQSLATLANTEPFFPIPYNSLATLAWETQSVELLRVAIDGGGSVHDSVIYLTDSDRVTVEFYDLLWKHDWKQMRSLKQLPDVIADPHDVLDYPPEALMWLLDHGMVVTKQHFENPRFWRDVPHQADNVAALIKHQGNGEILKGTGLLAQAAYHGKTRVVEVLMAAGLDPNETLMEHRDIRGEHTPFWPLYDAVVTNREQIVKLLLDHGADPMQVLPRNGLTLIQLCEDLKGSDNILFMLRQATSVY
ncbi:hypothetical protein K431DRAFT_316925 [Polychaeton citri CBS 116435]|uniref:Ankyrin n=1 Tax=Polychaeton citri CBS 116435 TaxID=1314669 RepID=A0A9P4PXY7_9PEZI|nr:hypothetical protein K431DRAFT_316925 [Polychaeton citri CBS 116435]